MMKVYEVVDLVQWEESRGIISSSCYSSDVIEVDEKLLLPGAQIDFSWWTEGWDDDVIRAYHEKANVDVQITVRFYRADYDPGFDEDEPLASWSIWESEIIEELLYGSF